MRLKILLLASKLDDIEKRIRPTICNTYSFSYKGEGTNQRLGNITEEDLDAIKKVIEELGGKFSVSRNDIIDECVMAIKNYRRDASFDDSAVGALEHNSNQRNIVDLLLALKDVE